MQQAGIEARVFNENAQGGVSALDALARGESTAAYVTPDEPVAAAQRHGAYA